MFNILLRIASKQFLIWIHQSEIYIALKWLKVFKNLENLTSWYRLLNPVSQEILKVTFKTLDGTFELFKGIVPFYFAVVEFIWSHFYIWLDSVESLKIFLVKMGSKLVKNYRKWSKMVCIYLYMFINTIHSQFMESIENSQFGYNFADCPQAATKVI